MSDRTAAIERVIIGYLQRSGAVVNLTGDSVVAWNARIDSAELTGAIVAALAADPDDDGPRLKVGDRVLVIESGIVGEIRSIHPGSGREKRPLFSILTPGGRTFAHLEMELELVKPAARAAS